MGGTPSSDTDLIFLPLSIVSGEKSYDCVHTWPKEEKQRVFKYEPSFVFLLSKNCQDSFYFENF